MEDKNVKHQKSYHYFCTIPKLMKLLHLLFFLLFLLNFERRFAQKEKRYELPVMARFFTKEAISG